MASTSTKKPGKKRCNYGKSCGATCISRNKLCLIELGPEAVKAIKYARSLIQKLYGKRDNPNDRQLFVRVANEKIEKLSKELSALPKNSPRRKEIVNEIRKIEESSASARGYSDRQRAFRTEEGANAYMKNLYD